MSRPAIEAALRQVYDPCSQAWSRPISVLDLGLVRDISETAGAVTVRMSLTAPFCMAVAVLIQAVERRLTELPGVHSVQVDLDTETPWRPEFMTDRGRAQLARARHFDHTREDQHACT